MSRPFIDIDASYNVLTADLVKLHDKIKQVTNVIGPYRARESVALWMDSVSVRLTSLEEFKNSLTPKFAIFQANQASFKDDINHTMEEVAELQAVTSQNQGWMANVDQT